MLAAALSPSKAIYASHSVRIRDAVAASIRLCYPLAEGIGSFKEGGLLGEKLPVNNEKAVMIYSSVPYFVWIPAQHGQHILAESRAAVELPKRSLFVQYASPISLKHLDVIIGSVIRFDIVISVPAIVVLELNNMA
jgi:hypothetical protein